MNELKGVISVGKYKVLFFVEDNAQEQIIPGLFIRIASNHGIARGDLDIHVPSSRGGGSIKALKEYLKDYGDELVADCIVLGSDGNCKGLNEKRKQLEKNLQKVECDFTLILTIPDPHIEHWYLLDSNALSLAVGESVTDHAPRKKCEKNHYKTLLKDAIQSSGVIPLQGGAEYGSEIANEINLYKASKAEQGFAFFEEQVKSWAKSLV